MYSCHASKPVTDEPKILRIVFGTGGGITGAFDEHIVLPDGNVYFYNSIEGEEKFKGIVPGMMLKKILDRPQKINFERIEFNQPSNKYYFIEIFTTKNSHRVVWGSNETAPNQVVEFYKELNNALSQLKPH
jgi:hypothetical protein